MTMVLPLRKAGGALFGACVASVACLLLGACTHGDESVSLEQTVAVPAAPPSRMMALASRPAAPAAPIASLPAAAGEIQAVRAHTYVDGLRQDIILRGGAVHGIQNSLTILARTDRRETLDERVPLFQPTEAAIRSEIGGQFPHIAMQVVERDSHNEYGPYGLALGRVGGDARCLYMWQWIDANRLPPDVGLVGPLSVRVRLCQAGTSFDAMAALVDHLTIGAAAAPDQGSVAAVQVAAPEAVDTPAPKAKRRVAAARHRTRTAHHHDEERRTAAQAPIEAPSGPRFMAPTTPAPQQAAQQRSADLSATRLSSDLPPEAYLGPKAAKAY